MGTRSNWGTGSRRKAGADLSQASETAVLRWAQEWPQARTLEQLSPSRLQELSLTHGVDAAVAVLFDRLRRAPHNQRLIHWMEAPAGSLNKTADSAAQGCGNGSTSSLATPAEKPESTWPRSDENIGVGCIAPAVSRSRVVVVPPLYDERFPEYPSSGRFVVESAAREGFATHWLPVPSIRTVADGSRQVREYLEQQPEPVILVSLSRSTLDVKQALAEMPADVQRRSLRAWLTITSTFKGTPLINQLCARPLRRWLFLSFIRRQKWGEQAFLDLLHGPSQPTWPRAALAEGILAVHVSAFPLQRHLRPACTNRAERWWLGLTQKLRLDRFGPHEGAALLSDLLDEPGEVYPVWGVPHWICPPWRMDSLLPKLLHYIDRYAPRDGGVAAAGVDSSETASAERPLIAGAVGDDGSI
jgi:hypothetical protein